jgi:hypothetical protein
VRVAARDFVEVSERMGTLLENKMKTLFILGTAAISIITSIIGIFKGWDQLQQYVFPPLTKFKARWGNNRKIRRQKRNQRKEAQQLEHRRIFNDGNTTIYQFLRDYWLAVRDLEERAGNLTPRKIVEETKILLERTRSRLPQDSPLRWAERISFVDVLTCWLEPKSNERFEKDIGDYLRSNDVRLLDQWDNMNGWAKRKPKFEGLYKSLCSTYAPLIGCMEQILNQSSIPETHKANIRAAFEPLIYIEATKQASYEICQCDMLADPHVIERSPDGWPQLGCMTSFKCDRRKSQIVWKAMQARLHELLV